MDNQYKTFPAQCIPYKSIVMDNVRILNGSPVTIYTCPDGKKAMIEGNPVVVIYPTLEPVASTLRSRYTLGGILFPSPSTTGITPGTPMLINLGVTTILNPGDTLSLENTLALGDCTIRLAFMILEMPI